MAETESQPLLESGETPSSRGLLSWLSDAARRLKREIVALYIASSDPRMPLIAKIFATCVIAYALSPFDLIPDCIPVLGILDDLILLPLGLWITIRLIPEEVMQDARDAATDREQGGGGRLPVNWFAGALVILIWVASLVWLANFAWHKFKGVNVD